MFQCVTPSSTHFSGSALKASKYDSDIKHMEPLGKIVTKSERVEGTKKEILTEVCIYRYVGSS